MTKSIATRLGPLLGTAPMAMPTTLDFALYALPSHFLPQN